MMQALHALASLLLFCLVVIGMVGIAFHAFRGEGWLLEGFERLSSLLLDHPSLLIPLGIVVLSSFALWRKCRSMGLRNRFADTIAYGFVAAGIFFVYRLAAHGTP